MATEFPVRANTKGAVNDIDQLVAALQKAGKEAGLTEKQIDDIASSTRKAKSEGANLNSELNKVNGTLKTVGSGLLSLFAVDQIKQFVGHVVSVTSEFQKLEAVLTNSLGSKSEAQRALKTIQEIAAKTPFSVLQLTQSYIKLVNQGFKPTAAEIIKLGDLAASTGKEFDMLTEAIIDAQTGEFERLKEFGIRASKAGDQVTFTFKGVQTQTEFTSEAIRNYILALGDAEGVSGSMAAISETLGGQISNLGDSWDTFLKTIGQGNSGALSGTVSLLKQALDIATDLVKTKDQRDEDVVTRRAAAVLDYYKSLQFENEQLQYKEKIYRKILDLQIEVAELEKQGKGPLSRNAQIIQDLKLQIDSWWEAIASIREYNDEIYSEEAKKEQDNLNKKVTDEAKARERVNSALEATVRLKSEAAQQSLMDNNIKLDDIAIKPIGEIKDPFANERKKQRDQEKKDQENADEERRGAIEEMIDYQLMAIEEVFKARVINTQLEIAMLQRRYNAELELAGDNEKAKGNIERKFNAERNRLLQKQAQQEQAAALFSIAVNQGPAIAKTAAQLGYPWAIPFIGAVGLLFALQMQNTKKLAQVRYAADGDYDIDGPGTERSDSIPYMLSKHETVVHARGTKKFGALLEPIVEDSSLTWGDIRGIVDANLPTELVRVRPQSQNGNPLAIEELREIKRAILNKKETRIQIDENGFSNWVGSKDQWTRYVDDRYQT